MNIEIKKLSPELADDYISYFDHLDFSHKPEWGGCYCVWYHWNDKLELESKDYKAAGGTCFNREVALRLIQKGMLQGYLAYSDGKVAGWCNCNNKASYDALKREKNPELWDETDDRKKIKSIVCYTIAPAMRRQGVATQLLAKVCEDAKAEGYDFVEAYPETGEVSAQSYHGPYSIYEKNGFELHKDLGDMAVVRKYI